MHHTDSFDEKTINTIFRLTFEEFHPLYPSEFLMLTLIRIDAVESPQMKL